MKVFWFVIMVVISVVAAGFAVLNATPVQLNYYFGNSQLPLSMLMVIVLATGVLLGWSVFAIAFIKLKAENFRLRHKMKSTEKELETLRALPAK